MIDIKIINKIAIEAGLKILEVNNFNDFKEEIKGDNSPLTKATKQAIIIKVVELKKHYQIFLL